MSSVLLLIVLSVALLLCGAAHPAAEQPDLRAFVEKLNSYLEATGREELSVSDVQYVHPLLSGQLKDIRFGNLSTTAVRTAPQEVSESTVGPVTVLNFNVNLGLDDFFIVFNFCYSFLGKYNYTGFARIEAATNSANLIGTIAYGDDDCEAHLQSAVLTQIGNYRSTIQPDDFHLAQVISFLHNHIIKSDQMVFNQIIAENIQKEGFQKYFSKVICEGGQFI